MAYLSWAAKKPTVPELDRGGRSFSMDRICQPSQSRYDFFPHPHLVPKGAAVKANRAVGNGSHGHTPCGHPPVVLYQRLCDVPFLAHTLKTARPDYSIAQFKRADLALRKDRSIFHSIRV